MCDGLGRQFSYSCPNTTLFQQRMLICDHWYMVNCSKSELDYSANLLIGQKDKPFVDDSSENPYHRTPRPDLETHPYAPMFRNDYRQAKAQFGTHLNLVGGEVDNGNATDSPQYFLPSHWSTHYSKGSTTPIPFKKYKDKATVYDTKLSKNSKPATLFKEKKDIPAPSRITLPPFAPSNTFRPTENIYKAEQKFTRTANEQTAVFPGFKSTTPKDIPNEGAILDPLHPSKVLLPPKFDSFPEDRNNFPSSERPVQQKFPQAQTPVFDSQIANSLKTPQPARTEPPKAFHISKSTPTFSSATPTSFPKISKTTSGSSVPLVTNEVEPPSIYYQPPKLTAYVDLETSTMDPLSFYKLVPSKDLQPPKLKDRIDNDKTDADTTTLRSVTKKDIAKSTAISSTSTEKISEDDKWKSLRNIFFIPEYDFPLELESRPGYDSGVSSFQVNQAPPNPEIRPTEKSAGPKCDPKCDPAFLTPGSCKPCVTIRR